jgi:hypothetical protein
MGPEPLHAYKNFFIWSTGYPYRADNRRWITV